MAEQVHIIGAFRGIDENLASFDQRDRSNYTRSMLNVTAQYGRIVGRKGTNLFEGLWYGLDDTIIIGISQFTKADGTSYVMLIGDNNVVAIPLAAPALNNVTGTTMTATSISFVSSTVIDDNFIFTNAVDPVRKWSGSGNTANIGGSPPLAARVINFEDFLMLGYTNDGTAHPSRIVYADDWDVTWPAENELNLVETPGSIRNWAKIGRTLYVYKTDGIVAIRFIGGPQRFSQHQVPFDLGLVAPNSLVSIPQLGHIFLATDFNLYLNSNGSVNKLPANMRNTLQDVLRAAGSPAFASGSSDPTNDLYMLQFANTVDEWLSQRILFNYRTGEWSLHDYPVHQFVRTASVRLTTGYTTLATDDNPQVYQLDAGPTDTEYEDEEDTHTEKRIDRFYTTDWQELGHHGDKYLNRVELWFKRTQLGKVAVSYATDFEDDFKGRQVFSLSDSPVAGDILVEHALPIPRLGMRFNPKVELMDGATYGLTDGSENVTELEIPELKELRFYYTPVATSSAQARNQ